MWIRIVHLVIRYRLPLTIAIGLITAFMGYHASKARIAHSFVSTLPADNIAKQYLDQFREQFGEDGSIIAIGIKDSSLFQLKNFVRFDSLCQSLTAIHGIQRVMSLPQMQILKKDVTKRKLVFTRIFPSVIKSQAALDSLLHEARKQMLYDDYIINRNNEAVAVLISLDGAALNSSERVKITDQVAALGSAFQMDTGIMPHYAGLPFIRSIITSQLSKELILFLCLSIGITAIALFVFFRSFKIVLLAVTVIGVAIIWSIGTMELLGFKITLISGMIPPLMAVIGIPNTIYLINKYHAGFASHGKKILAIGRMVQRVGLATCLTNVTTAIGFLVLISTNISILSEFGIVAGLNVLAMFGISIILIPGILSWMSSPSPKHIRHLELKVFDSILFRINKYVQGHRNAIYTVFIFIVVAIVGGIYRLHTLSYITDDMPKGSQLERDLAFFEQNFSGVMPLEVVVDTHKKRGVLNTRNLKKIEELASFIAQQKEISNPISIIGFMKAARQAFYNNNPKRYALPTHREQAFILRYLKGVEVGDSPLLGSFVDSSLQTMRISYHMVDVGSHKMDSLINRVIRPAIDTIFADSPIEVRVTGTTPVFVQGNKFLVANLWYSLLLAFGLIAIIMGILFRNGKMIFVSLVPNLIPMMITAALMGYLNIPLKPSTVLIFSLVLGISIDYSIHFLTKYRQELSVQKQAISKAISNTIMEVGKSMLYTSIILFAGFIIFTFSSFGGTIALGLLTSTTLAMSALTNLLILPSLIITLNHKKYKATLEASSI